MSAKFLGVTLNATELGNIKGWLNFLHDHPQYIGVPGSVPQNVPPGWTPTWQTRIVLEDQTKERFREILFQFTTEELGWDPQAFWASYNNGGGVTPPPPSPVTLPPDCPVTLQVEAEFTKETRGDPGNSNQNVCVYYMWRTNVLVIPFRIPMPKNGVNFTQSDMVGGTICEYGSPPTHRQCTISRTPGDFGKQSAEGGLLPDPSVIQSSGLTPSPYFFLKDGWAKPGDMLYFNVRFWTTDYDTGKGKTTVQENQLDMAQRSRFSVQWPQDAQ